LRPKLSSSFKKLKPKLNAKCKKPLTNLRLAVDRSRIIISSNHGSFFAEQMTCGIAPPASRVQILPELISNEVAALCGYRSHACSRDGSDLSCSNAPVSKSSWRILLGVPSGESVSWSRSPGKDSFDGLKSCPEDFNESRQAGSNVPGAYAGENAFGISGSRCRTCVIDRPCRWDCDRTASGGQMPTCFLACAQRGFRVRHQKDIFHRI
jgi:hypothetical protein